VVPSTSHLHLKVGGNALILALHVINDTLATLDVLVTLVTLGPPGTSWDPGWTPQDLHPEYDTIPQEGCRDPQEDPYGPLRGLQPPNHGLGDQDCDLVMT